MGNEPRLGSKIFYKIGEVSQLTKLPAYVLRFWESEFAFLKPKKSRGNQRLYVQHDIETVLEIRRMLYEEGHTLAGVKRYWARRSRGAGRQSNRKDLAQRMRGDLQAILRILETPSGKLIK
jgi:DNA-binding transcriptional MerR regulator